MVEEEVKVEVDVEVEVELDSLVGVGDAVVVFFVVVVRSTGGRAMIRRKVRRLGSGSGTRWMSLQMSSESGSGARERERSCSGSLVGSWSRSVSVSGTHWCLSSASGSRDGEE